ncbi:hypothetical protein V6Z11_A05G287500 [Gossypium hirsutum]|uniref:Uncharacterized protein n=2 Tax=Gossypium TaxID=3633 RepID=A0A5D2QLX1_GOSTO|nr:hypothetical protein ES288_A05G287500v1 [Gossypium darwinii]TYI29092.1 hypothetical protein ES332_A05G292100v1 [Gossypium tomentosum]
MEEIGTSMACSQRYGGQLALWYVAFGVGWCVKAVWRRWRLYEGWEASWAQGKP